MRVSDAMREAADNMEKVEDGIERWWTRVSATAWRVIDHLLFSLNTIPFIFLTDWDRTTQVAWVVGCLGVVATLEILRRRFNTESLPASTS